MNFLPRILLPVIANSYLLLSFASGHVMMNISKPMIIAIICDIFSFCCVLLVHKNKKKYLIVQQLLKEGYEMRCD
jgi:hypothetical protein